MPLIRHEAMMTPSRRLKKPPPPFCPTTMTLGWGVVGFKRLHWSSAP